MNSAFLVVDTNVFVSANLIVNSISSRAFDKAFTAYRLALSEGVLAEYAEVLYRKKLDKYLTNTRRETLLRSLEKNAVFFNPVETIDACRDQKDNLFLELAVACEARCILSGDSDLLVLNPFRQIPIVTSSEFLELF